MMRRSDKKKRNYLDNWCKTLNFAIMNEMQEFRENARLKDLCAQYSDKWDNCQSKKQLIDTVGDANGIPYLCRSTVEKWGLSPEYIADKFKAFVNGNYISEQNGYTSEIYCLYDGAIKARTTITAIIACKGTIYIPQNHVCKIHIADSRMRIEGEGVCHVYQHGSCFVSPSPSVKCVFEEGSDE